MNTSHQECFLVPTKWWDLQWTSVYFENQKIVEKQQMTFQEARHIFQLGDIVFPVPTVFGEQGQVFQVLSAGISWVEIVKLSVHSPPSLDLLLSEFNLGNWVTTARRRGRKDTP